MPQLSLGDYQVNRNRIKTRAELKLAEIDKIVKWEKIVEMFSVVDKTDKHIGGRPRKETGMMVKILFIQSLYNLSDPELEDQLNDRLSFQRFAGLGLDDKVPDYSTIWRYKEALARQGLLKRLFVMIVKDLEEQGLILKKGTIVDATIIKSVNRPLSRERRKNLEDYPSSQIDPDARSTKKNGKYYYGYKGHVGVDVGSVLIRRAGYTSANVHDSTQTAQLQSGDEKSMFGDKAYSNAEDKQRARQSGVYYGILDKARRGQKLSKKQVRHNRQMSSIRSKVEHPFAYLKRILKYEIAMAHRLYRNEMRFMMSCIIYNVMRANLLLKRAT